MSMAQDSQTTSQASRRSSYHWSEIFCEAYKDKHCGVMEGCTKKDAVSFIRNSQKLKTT